MPAAATNPLDVCNLALFNVGSTQDINDLDENTAEAKACKRYFAGTRDACLEMFPWDFAKKRAVLAELNTTRTGWDFVYAWPADCITPRFIWAGMRQPISELKIPFETESTSVPAGVVSGKCIVTDEAEAELIYTAQVENVALWSPLFVRWVAWELSVNLCLSLPINVGRANNAKAQAAMAKAEAGAAQLRAQQGDRERPSSYTTAR